MAKAITLDHMRLWSDEQKLQFSKKHVVDGHTLYSLWNETAHPETLFYDFYDEVMVNLYTPENKQQLLEQFVGEIESNVDDKGMPWTDLDAFLVDHPSFKEHAAEDCYEFNPAWEDVMKLFIFNWLLCNEYWAEEFLLVFANGELPE